MQRPAAKMVRLGLVLASLLPAVAFGDDVYLTNGEVFEGVVAELGDTRIRMHLPIGGEMTLPRSQVWRVEEKTSVLARYFERKAGLLTGDGSAEEWLGLARWGRLNELPAYREAALVAAELAPRLAELAPLMRGLGYELDEDLGRWILYDEVMRRRGLVFDEGAWVSLEERRRRVETRRAAAEPVRRRESRDEPQREETRRQEGPTGNEVAIAQLEFFRDLMGTVGRGYPGFLILGHGSIFNRPDPGGGIHPTASSGGTLAFQATPGASAWDAFRSRQPGSFLPLRP